MKQSKINNAENEIEDEMARHIAETILKRQQDFANKIYMQTAGWRKTQQIIFLIFTILVVGGMSLVVMIICLRTPESSQAIVPTQITPVRSVDTEEKSLLITDKEFKAVKEYQQNHPDLFNTRPGLYDSLQLIEQIYQSQKK